MACIKKAPANLTTDASHPIYKYLSISLSHFFISDCTNIKPIIAAITSDITAAQSIVTMLFDNVAIVIDAGTNITTSRSKIRLPMFSVPKFNSFII